jgi:multiple antibiotic resistance protein
LASVLEKSIRDFVILWATIDPIGTMALFLGLTASLTPQDRRRIALRATLYSALILIPCIVVGQFLLDGLGVELPSLRIAGGIILFLFGLQMVFGLAEPKGPQQGEVGHDLAVFPLAVPSIASPGAIMSVIILTDNDRYSIGEQGLTGVILIGVLVATWALMRFSETFYRFLGKNGSAILIRVMGMLLASLAVEMVIEGVFLTIARHQNG